MFTDWRPVGFGLKAFLHSIFHDILSCVTFVAVICFALMSINQLISSMRIRKLAVPFAAKVYARSVWQIVHFFSTAHNRITMTKHARGRERERERGRDGEKERPMQEGVTVLRKWACLMDSRGRATLSPWEIPLWAQAIYTTCVLYWWSIIHVPLLMINGLLHAQL